MTIYEKQNSSGNAWFRGSNNKKISGNIALSAFGEKYSNISPTLTWDITSNNIKRLDVIQDIIIIETPAGFFVDKFEIVDGLPIPTGNYDNSTTYPESYSMDYWFDESDRKIYTFCVGISSFIDTTNPFTYEIKEYDIKNDQYSRKSILHTDISGYLIDVLDPIKVCYNTDSHIFNVTTVFSISGASSFNIISTNIKRSETFEIDAVKIVIPINS